MNEKTQVSDSDILCQIQNDLAKLAPTVLKESPNLWQRICAVRADMKAVERDKVVGDGSYAYAVTTHDEINKSLKPLLCKHGLVDILLPGAVEIVDTGVKYGRTNPRPLLQYRGTYCYKLVNIDDPEDCLIVDVTGWGEDPGDKAPGKAATYAFKEGRKKVFSIGTGDDEEGRIDESKISDATEPLSVEQIDHIIALADELFSDAGNEQLKRMCSKIFSVSNVSDIPAQHFEQAVNLLKNQHKRMSGPDKPKVSESDTTKGKEEPGADG